MSTIKNPVGPEPSKVYWRRRVLVLAGLLAVIAIIVLIIVRPGSSSDVGSSAAPPASTTAPATTTPPAAASEPQNVDAAPPADGQTAACDPANIKVIPVTDAETYAAGVNPQLSLSVTNTGGTACSINVGTAQQVYTIRSGDEQYWVSTDCQASPTDMPTVIAAGATLASTPFAWDRTRSAADTCASTDRPQVPAGGASYHLDVSIGGFASTTSTQFILG
ncbi:hypothetical protein SAMN06295879_1311 [Agreia bicolorata]|uniref:DUF4232 domain-containing protein n=1 Tax=Agreia bicolorata TaxID=110935 RepID=A0A1T4XLM9_9MICO|nr:hypothetical protein [Agreia bicolorata]KJC65043.1 hypothetical protein TZ00_05575 [Agreia bicolorata]SKA90404.1 hypothetical protein SAMN06295879_1311 [Agreia bicolorata]